jgi:tetratricopeptide (TPR) repeat protein
MSVSIDADLLLGKLCGLPLALVQAGAYIGATGLTAEEYIAYYDETWDRLMDLQNQAPYLLQEYAERSVLTTWKMSYEQVLTVKPEAARLLDQWAFLHPGDISYELVGNYTRSCEGSEEARERKLVATNKLSFQDSVGVLAQYSLVNKSEGMGNFSIHAVVHEWSLYNIVDDRAREQLCMRAICMVAKSVPSSKDEGDLQAARKLLPHARMAAARHVKMREVGSFGLELYEVARFMSDWESSQEVESLYERALRVNERELGAQNTLTLDNLNHLGNLFWKQGELVKAEGKYLLALRGKEVALGVDHTSTLDTVNNLGKLYSNQGKLDKAEQMYQRALTGYEKALGPDHTSTLHTVNNLGVLYCDQGKLDKAEQMYQRALTGYEKALGPDHTSTLQTINNLGVLYRDQGKLDKAEQMYQRALAGYEKALGPDHTSTLDTVNNLGLLYSDQLDKAERMYQRALTGYEKALGKEALTIPLLHAVNNLGNLYFDHGKLDEAERTYQRALTGYEKVLGKEALTIPLLNTVNNLGNLYRNRGKLDEAERMYQRALLGFQSIYGPSHDRVIAISVRLASTRAVRAAKASVGYLVRCVFFVVVVYLMWKLCYVH